jgi:exodeoxyribonuclease VII small subunit
MDSAPKTFEEKLARMDQIVKDLESGNAPLEKAIELYAEGKKLAAECEAMLKSAQSDVERANESPR